MTGSHHELLVLGVPAVLHACGRWRGSGRDGGHGRAALPPPPVPAASPAPLLPDNPKPTTRPRPRALTGRRGKGRARRRRPLQSPRPSRAPAPPRPGLELAASAGKASEPAPLSRRVPAAANPRPSARPCVPRRRRVRLAALGASPCPGSRPGLLSHGPAGGARPAARLAGQKRSLPLGPRTSAACLSVCLSDPRRLQGGGWLPCVSMGAACIVAVAGVSGVVSSPIAQ